MVRVATTIVNCYIPVVLNFHDFITKFTPFSFYDSILVVVDCLTLCTKIITKEKITKLFLDHVFLYRFS
jgi:hypothetical protein